MWLLSLDVNSQQQVKSKFQRVDFKEQFERWTLSEKHNCHHNSIQIFQNWDWVKALHQCSPLIS
jgi:hypothetical protein